MPCSTCCVPCRSRAADYNRCMSKELTPAERRDLKARAHALHPVVMIGNDGLTPAVLKAIDEALRSHELIKIRAAGEDRDVRPLVRERLGDRPPHPLAAAGHDGHAALQAQIHCVPPRCL